MFFMLLQRWRRAVWVMTLAVCCVSLLAACAPKAPVPGATTPPRSTSQTAVPQPRSTGTPEESVMPDVVPNAIRAKGGGEPTVRVYWVEDSAIHDMLIEEYLCGVLAGEMKNDWPEEALRAQAIIARTFALKFIEDKGGSKYEGANLSTDITEAQAYDPEGVNDRIRQAIESTRGEVIIHEDQLIYAWFHAHAGGITALAKEGLEYEDEEPPYIQSVKSEESDQAPEEDAKWTATFSPDKMAEALTNWGISGPVKSIKVAQTGESGRAITFEINGEVVSAPSLRLRLGGTEMKSTLIESVSVDGGNVAFQGKGYGHGVGMSQWGAYAMAENGDTAEKIIEHYFAGVRTVKAWS